MNETTPLHSASGPKGRRWLWLLAAFFALVLISVVFTVFDLDRSISGQFYRPGDGWYLAKAQPWDWLYRYGTIPGIVLAVGSLTLWLASFYLPRLQRFRKPFLVVVLTTVLAAGLLVNAVLKQYWGRPRPKQTIEYGGNWEYRPIFPPGTPGKGASFPCGHCTMGFVFLGTAAFYQRSRMIAIAGVGSGLVLGGLLSAARVVQGAHFTSDTLWSFGIVGITAAALTFYLPDTAEPVSNSAPDQRSRRQRLWLTIATCCAILLMAAGFLTRRPFYTSRFYPLELPRDVRTIDIHMPMEPERVDLEYAAASAGELQVDAHGFGWLKFKYSQQLTTQKHDETLDLDLDIAAKSYFAELDHALVLTLPQNARGQIDLKVNGEPLHR